MFRKWVRYLIFALNWTNSMKKDQVSMQTTCSKTEMNFWMEK